MNIKKAVIVVCSFFLLVNMPIIHASNNCECSKKALIFGMTGDDCLILGNLNAQRDW